MIVIILVSILIFTLIVMNVFQWLTSASRMGLDDLYDAFDGELDMNSRLIGKITMSAGVNDCEFDIVKEGIGGKYKVTSVKDDEFCNKFTYNDITHDRGELYDMLIENDEDDEDDE